MRLQGINFAIRYPAFPVICDINGVLLTASSPEELARQLCSIEVDPHGRYPIVSSCSARWMLDVTSGMLIPSFGKQWTKAAVIRLFNESRNATQQGVRYDAKSLANRRFDRVVGEIAHLLRPNHSVEPTA